MSQAGSTRAGFIGVGKMGSAMVRRARLAGFEVHVQDAFPAAAEALAEADPEITVAATPAEVARAAQLVCIVVQDDAQAREVLLADDGVLQQAGSDHCIVIHSTLTLAATLELAEHARKRGVALLDAGVSGREGQISADAGELCVMVGGDAASFERARPLLESYGELVLHLGPTGSGMRAKLARNTICYLSYVALFEGLRLAEAAGVSREAMTQITSQTGLECHATNTFLAHRGGADLGPHPVGSAEAETAAFNALIGRKDLRSALELARSMGLELPCTEAGIEAMGALFGAPE